MTEQWLPIAGWEGEYSISDAGRVRSEHRVVPRKDGGSCTRYERLLKPSVNGSGHRWVKLWHGSEYTIRFVHSLVLETFVCPRPDGMESLHADGNPANNAAVNLRWGTSSENKADSVRHGTHNMARRTHCAKGHRYDAANTGLTARGYRRCRECNRERCAIRRRESAVAR